jgi:hypothetical protein
LLDLIYGPSLTTSWAVGKTKQTLLCMIAFVFPNLIGTIVLICVAPGPSNQGGLIFAFYMMQCFQAVSFVTPENRSAADW